MPDIGPITLSHTSFADLDLVFGEDAAERQFAWLATTTTGRPELEPETVDAFDSQILAGLVSP